MERAWVMVEQVTMRKVVISMALAATGFAALGCGSSDPGSDPAQEKAFKSPDKANLPTPKAGTPLSTPAVSSLDDNASKPPPAATNAQPGAGK